MYTRYFDHIYPLPIPAPPRPPPNLFSSRFMAYSLFFLLKKITHWIKLMPDIWCKAASQSIVTYQEAQPWIKVTLPSPEASTCQRLLSMGWGVGVHKPTPSVLSPPHPCWARPIHSGMVIALIWCRSWVVATAAVRSRVWCCLVQKKPIHGGPS